MRTEPHFHPGPAGAAVIRPEPAVALADPVTLTPVDRVTLTTLVDNSPDLLLPDQGPVRQHTRLVAVATAAARLTTNVLNIGRGRRAIGWVAAVALGLMLAGCANGNQVSPSGTPTSTANRAPVVAGSIWVANEGGDSLTVLDAASNAVTTTLTGLKHPHNVQVSPDGATVYAVSHSDNIVVAIDPATYTVAAVAATGPAPAHVIDAPNGKVYVTNTADGTVSVYQAPGLQPVGRIQLGDMPHGLRAAAGGSVIVVANTMAGALDLIDPATDQSTGAIPVGPGPAQVAVTADGRYAYAGITNPPAVVKVDLAARKVVGTARVSDSPVQLYLTPDESTVLSADQGTAQHPGQHAVGDRHQRDDHSRHRAHRLRTARRSNRHSRNPGLGDQHLRQHRFRHRPTHPVGRGDSPGRRRTRGYQLLHTFAGAGQHQDDATEHSRASRESIGLI